MNRMKKEIGKLPKAVVKKQKWWKKIEDKRTLEQIQKEWAERKYTLYYKHLSKSQGITRALQVWKYKTKIKGITVAEKRVKPEEADRNRNINEKMVVIYVTSRYGKKRETSTVSVWRKALKKTLK